MNLLLRDMLALLVIFLESIITCPEGSLVGFAAKIPSWRTTAYFASEEKEYTIQGASTYCKRHANLFCKGPGKLLVSAAV